MIVIELRIPSSFFSGPEAEAHGRAADVGGVRPGEQGADRGPDRAVGGQPGAPPLRAVQAQVLHGLPPERRAAQPQGEIYVQGWAERWSLGCVNAAGKARQKW